METDDFTAFTEQQIKSGHAKLQSLAWLRTLPAGATKLSVVEKYLTATEFDPPSRHAPFRMRPTALQELPVGLQFEGDVTEEPGGNLSLNLKLQHSTAKPIEPGLEETLRISADENAKYPGAKHEFDEWAETVNVIPGK
ncbi:MAG: hypothetical protein B7Z37_31360, partial [Verrucomicrobia bacterium 12-59-8]